MYKIKFIPTGHVFILPESEAKRLKKQTPNEYLILEKNCKKYKDKIGALKNNNHEKFILSKVLDK